MATDYNKLKVTELKAELKKLGLPQNGLKAELVARLESAADDQSLNDADDADDHVEDTQEKSTSIDTNGNGAEAPPPNDATDETAETSPQPQVPTPKEASPTPQDNEPTPSEEGPANGEISPSNDASDKPAEHATESQKRKRKSPTPTPGSEDMARKKTKVEDQEDSKDTHTEAPEPQAETLENTTGNANRSDKDDTEMTDAKPQDQATADGSQEEKPLEHLSPGDEQLAAEKAEMERDIEPALHPATTALYIKNFMRPLRPDDAQDHLLNLATAPGALEDPNTVKKFYLDHIRTHVFCVFNTVSEASRARTRLHGRVWPDETNRKPLVVDFIPAEVFDEWVETEQSSRGGRNRFEVQYSLDEDDNVVAKLTEVDATSAPSRPPLGPADGASDGRRPSTSGGPPRPPVGVEGAPSGPRGYQQGTGGREPPAHPGRAGRLEPGQSSTRAQPTVLFKPVSKDLVNSRIDALVDISTNRTGRDLGKDYHRYYFEHGDSLVNRGPEIFLGIRPPRRERERRRDMGGGGGGRNRRNGGGGGGGGRRNRRNANFRGGVPRGGDRFRPSERYDEDRYRPGH